jgi:hypothetical protein
MKSSRYPRLRNFKTPIFLTALSFLINTGCKKTDIQQFTPGFNVYMAGSVNNSAVFWKNGQGTELADSSSTSCIAVSGTDVFIGGRSNLMAGYWKNGQFVSMGQVSASVTGIALSGSDFYLVGQVNGAVFWKNGILNNLETITRVSSAQGICFSGSDMYVVGFTASIDDTAVQWKNGVRTNYTPYNGQIEMAYAVAVSGTDIYAAGVYNNMPVYWKNGVMNELNLNDSAGPTGGFASAISIVGTDVYIVGSTTLSANNIQATIWKNGISTNLSNNTSKVSNATGIAIAGSDIYVVGNVTSADGRTYSPVYWKNGIEYKLSGTGTINAICVGN